MLNHILDEEAAKGRPSIMSAPRVHQRIQSDKDLKHLKLSPMYTSKFKKLDDSTAAAVDKQTKIRTSVTMRPTITKNLISAHWSNQQKIEEEEKSSYGSESYEEEEKKKEVLMQKYNTNIYGGEVISLSKKLSLRKKQQSL